MPVPSRPDPEDLWEDEEPPVVLVYENQQTPPRQAPPRQTPPRQAPTSPSAPRTTPSAPARPEPTDDAPTRRTPAPSPAEQEPPARLLLGQDPQGIVKVQVGEAADIVSTRLANGWRRRIDPQGLARLVPAAANAAITSAMTAQAERAQAELPPEALADPLAWAEQLRKESAPKAAAPGDDSPLEPADVMALIDSATADLAEFTERLESTEAAVSAESGGGHVRGTAQKERFLSIAIDATWAAEANDASIEAEITEMLRALRNKAFPPELTGGPQSPAISKLQALVADPHRMLRRLGLKTN